MEHLTYENFVIGTGTMSVTTVDPGFEGAYAKAMEAMHAVGEEMTAGKQMPLCGSCQDMMRLVKAGAKMENVDAKGAHILLLTSTDPEVIKELQAHGRRSIDEMAQLMDKKPAATGHERPLATSGAGRPRRSDSGLPGGGEAHLAALVFSRHPPVFSSPPP